ncbi:30S ribosomal protein S8 [Buchnera aphidicola]|uniref:30S ribosomal protein S8 n=1 Tax=Buchnera aphidicola TaxID=9 RepID=UPI0031B89EF3
MSMQDPISDMLTRIRNSQSANKDAVSIPASKFKIAISNVLRYEGYIDYFVLKNKNNQLMLKIFLKYFDGKPVISEIVRISKPSLRVYHNRNNLPIVMNGLGIAILSTSKGVMSSKRAFRMRVGGEVICTVS